MSLAVLAAGALFTLPPAALDDAGHIELGIATTAGATIRHGLGSSSEPQMAAGLAYGGALIAGVRVVGGLRLGVIGATEFFAHPDWEPPAIWMAGGWIGGRCGRRASIGFMIAAGAAYGYARQ